MPELPEVETVRRGLANLLPGRTVLRTTTIDSPKSFPNAPNDVEQFLYEATIVGVRRRAKVLIIDLSSEYSLVVHLKMTGQLVFRGEDRVQNLEYGIRNLEVKISETSEPPTSFAGGHPNDSLVGKLPDRSTRVQIDFTDGSHLFFNDQRKFGWI